MEQLQQSVQRARHLREDILEIRRVYDDPQGSLEGIEIKDAAEFEGLFFELVSSLQAASSELNELFAPRRVLLDQETVVLHTPVPLQMRQFNVREGGVIVLTGGEVTPSIQRLVRELGVIPPWGKRPPIP